MLILIVCILVLLTAAAFYTYSVAFFSSCRRKKQPVLPLTGPAYDPYRAQMRSLQKELEAIPYEPVTIRAKDGTRLCGRYYLFPQFP